jgi:hypothetical protein
MHCGAEVTESSTNKQHHLPCIPNSNIPNAKRKEKEEQKSYKSSRPREQRKRKSGMSGSRNRPIS